MIIGFNLSLLVDMIFFFFQKPIPFITIQTGIAFYVG